ncbi:MAG: 1,4-dihydroxy-2-naphthoate octaprenyltransferase [Elusimicrobia bacterium]|nr:1,4-dihydroxy-2-naphthoate octaprenyltransferase [Elusimicrobiota bacterium]
MTNSKEEILNEINKASICCVSTYSGIKIKNRMMHFAVSPDFNFYLSSMKTDPKTKQILLRSEVSMLIYIPGNTFPDDKEIELTGYAQMVREENKECAVQLLIKRSPVVSQLSQYNKLDMLAFIKIIPLQIKFRHVKDILQGISPTVIGFEQNQTSISDWDRFKKKINAWITETRYPFLSVTVLPVLLGTTIAFVKKSIFNPIYFVLALLGTVSLHLGTNIINDYFDHKSGNDEINNEFVRPFSGGSRMIQMGLLTPLEVLTGALMFFIVGSGIGLYLVYKCGLSVLLLGLIGVISGFFYTAPLFNWASKGIGELLVGLNFGVLVSLGSYYVQTGTFSWEVFWASLPLGILVTAILLINEFPDYTADKKVSKNTQVVRLGKEKSANIFGYIMISSYVVLVAGVIAGYLPKIILFGLISLPFAIQSVIYAKKFHSNSSDMAIGNGFTILCFNIVSVISIISYLWLSLRNLYLLPILFLASVFIVWNYKAVIRQKETFLRLKEII